MFLNNGIRYSKIIKALKDHNLHSLYIFDNNLKPYLEQRNKDKKLKDNLSLP